MHTLRRTPRRLATARLHGARAGALVALLVCAAAAACGSDGPESAHRTVNAYITGYSYFDNTPPGSARISNPVLRTTAGGTGTYEDPITVAVGHVRSDGGDTLDWPAGTRFYVPNIRRYLIVEDTCGDGSAPQDGPCHTGYPDDAQTWLDIWIGGEGGTDREARRCMSRITGVWTVLVDPVPGLATEPGPVYQPDGCTPVFGNRVVTAP